MSRIIAIGDIHGCVKTFHKLIIEEIQIRKSDTIYCIGDYIDRGPDSKGVIDLILDLRAKGYQVRTLRGNHEELMLVSVTGGEARLNWYANGGDSTLKSFGVNSFDEFDPKYKEFFHRTRYYFQNGPFVFVHAGLNFQKENPFTDRHAMLWSRYFVVDKQKFGDRILIHGHTPQTLEETLNPPKDNVINIDAGCVYRDRPGFGHLVAIDLTNKVWHIVRNCEGN